MRDMSATIRSRNLAVVGVAALSQPRGASPSRWGVPSPERRGKNGMSKRESTARERAQQYADALPRAAPQRRTASCVKQRSAHLPQHGDQSPAHSSAAAALKFTDNVDLEQMQILHAQQRRQVEALRKELPGLL